MDIKAFTEEFPTLSAQKQRDIAAVVVDAMEYDELAAVIVENGGGDGHPMLRAIESAESAWDENEEDEGGEGETEAE